MVAGQNGWWPGEFCKKIPAWVLAKKNGFFLRVDLKVTLTEKSILMQIKPKMVVLQKYTGEVATPN